MLEQFFLGGSMMYPLLGLSILGVAVLFDRMWAFYRYSRHDARALRSEILLRLEEGREEDAMTVCASTPGPVAAVLLVGLTAYAKLKKAGEPVETIRELVNKAMEDYYSHAMSAVEKRFNLLSMVGMSAPLFGMTGTVTGMIKSFDAMSQAASLDNSLVAGGISEALITTAWGLVIALMAVIPWQFFVQRAEQIGLQIEDATAEMTDLLGRMARHAR